MRTNRIITLLAGACLAALAYGQAAQAGILINVDKTTQRMTVIVDGRLRYTWPVSTGRPGYDTPSGTFRPFRMDLHHVSSEYEDAPMPYSIFFTGGGDAFHGTSERGLGRAVSHGCVRLSVANAATLWKLVSQEQMFNTLVQISGSVRQGNAARVARSGPAQGPRGKQGQQDSLLTFFPFGR